MKNIILCTCLSLLLLPAGLLAQDKAGPETSPGAVGDVWDLPLEKADFFSADRMIGQKLYNPRGEVVAEIRDVYFNQPTGQIIYVKVAIEGPVGLTEDLHLVPYKALKMNGRIVVDADREKIAGEPAWKAGIDEKEFGQTLHEYYGESPYWRDWEEQ